MQASLPPASCSFLIWFTLQPCRRRRHVPPNHQTKQHYIPEDKTLHNRSCDEHSDHTKIKRMKFNTIEILSMYCCMILEKRCNQGLLPS
jgi:hypothetical protein